LFDDTFNGTAKETTKKYIEMMEYLSSLLLTASTKVSATWETTGNVGTFFGAFLSIKMT
jgi:hypothetical protein